MISKIVFSFMVLTTCAALGMVIVLAGFIVFHKFSVYSNAVYINNLHMLPEKRT